MKDELYTKNDADTINRPIDSDNSAKYVEYANENVDNNIEQIDNNQEEKKNIFTKTIHLCGKFSLNIVQVIFFSLFAVAAVFFFIGIVIKGIFKRNK